MRIINLFKEKHHELWPIETWHTNTVLKGFDDVQDLPITSWPEENRIMSVWKVKSIWWRIKFLFSGEISFMCWGDTHPPVSIMIGETVFKNN
jgi:hypothetical protein